MDLTGSLTANEHKYPPVISHTTLLKWSLHSSVEAYPDPDPANNVPHTKALPEPQLPFVVE